MILLIIPVIIGLEVYIANYPWGGNMDEIKKFTCEILRTMVIIVLAIVLFTVISGKIFRGITTHVEGWGDVWLD